MKKVLALGLTLVMVLSLASVAMATPPQHENPATISLEGPDTVHVGDRVTLTATTLKQGSTYNDTWAYTPSGLFDSTTAGDYEESVTEKVEIAGITNYVSSVSFTAFTPGTYTVTYTMVMTASSSGVMFTGIATKSITVLANENTTFDFSIKSSQFRPQGNTQGNKPGKDDKYQLVITQLNVTRNGSTTVETVNIIVGGFRKGETDRRFDITYEGITKQFTMNGPQ